MKDVLVPSHCRNSLGERVHYSSNLISTCQRNLQTVAEGEEENDMSRMNVPYLGKTTKQSTPPLRNEYDARGSHALLQLGSDDQDDIDMSEDLKRFLDKNTRLFDQECEMLHAMFALGPSNVDDERDDDDESAQGESVSDFSRSHGDDVNRLGELWTDLSLADDDIPRHARLPIRKMSSSSAKQSENTITTMMRQNHAPDSSRSLNITMGYTLFDHCTYLKVSESSHLGFVCDTSEYFNWSARRSQGSMFELCQPVTEEGLSMAFFGLNPNSALTMPSCARLPVRTVIIRIRPDVLCGEVINSVFAANMASTNRSGGVHLMRKQGGHLRAVIDWGEDNLKYVYDAQICIRKLEPYERVLMIRIYHPTAEENVEVEGLDADRVMGEITSTTRCRGTLDLKNPLDLQLREACALVKLIRANEKSLKGETRERHWQDSVFPKQKRINSPRSASLYLRAVGSHCKSMEDQKEKGHFEKFPALCVKDWKVIQASTIALENTWESLSDRFVFGSFDLSFFGNPIEPSELLDQHFCMQLYLMTRDRTLQGIDSLLRAVEKQTYHVEGINSTFWRLVKTMVERYAMSEIITTIETEMPPLDDSNLEASLPSARDLILQSGILSKENLKSSSPGEAVESAVRVVQCGYEVQLGATHNERIDNLYNYATTRLSAKQSWLRKTYDTLLDCDQWNGKALEEATAFLALVEGHSPQEFHANAVSVDSIGLPPCQRRIESLVLLQFDIDRGTCRISATHVAIVVRQFFQRVKTTVFSLDEIEVRTRKSSGGCIEIVRGDEIHCLRPMGLDANDVSGFIGILQHLLNDQ
jgi:hypothetical protein